MKPNKGEAKQDFLKRCTSASVAEGNPAEQAYAACNLSWNEERGTRQALMLSLPVELTAVGTVDAAKPDQAEVKRQFAITAYTGKEMDTWFGKLVIDVDGIQTKEKMPVLREHERDRVVGTGSAFKDKGSLYVTGEFSKSTRDAKEVLALADEGYPWQASVAVWPSKIMSLKDEKVKATVNGREFAGPAEIWVESKVGEVSFVSLGRDDDTAAITLTHPGNQDVIVEIINANSKENENMPITIEQIKTESPELFAQIIEQGILSERTRVTEILSAEGDAEVTRKAIADGIEASECFKLFFNAEKAKRVAGLQELAKEATPPQGQEEPPDTPPQRAAHLQLAERAREIAAEKGINIADATQLAFQQNRELARAWVPVQPN